MIVHFYDSMDDSLLKFAVIVSKHDGKWVFCKHKERDTYEVPGGHREKGETIIEAARRELYEETGAIDFTITPVCVYSVIDQNKINCNGYESYGMLYYADINTFGDLPAFEIEKLVFCEEMPDQLTYPLIQPKLMSKVESVLLAK